MPDFCDTCDGEGYLEEDAWNGDHYTRKVPCPDCQGDYEPDGEREHKERDL